MADPKDIHEAMLAFQADPPVLTKDKRAHQSKYADLVQATEVILPRLNALGVAWKTWTDFLDDGKFVLRYELRHVASDTAQSGTWPLKLSENPQQMGSQVTYARRYALTVATGVAAEDEDDDGQTASGRRTAQRAHQPRRQAAAESGHTAQRAQQPARRAPGPPLPGEQDRQPSTKLLSDSQRGMLMGQFGRLGIEDRAARLRTMSTLVGRRVESASELTRAEASELINICGSALESEDPRSVMLAALAAAAEAGEAS